MRDISISATSLARFVSRTGDLSSGSYEGVSGIEGTRLHKKIFSDLKKQYGDDIENEYYLQGSSSLHETRLNVTGRADAVILDKATSLPCHIIEIKSFNSSKDSFAKLVRPEHESQLMIYAAMFFQSEEGKNVDSIRITLRYVSITTLEAYEDTSVISRDDAISKFDELCESYISFALKLLSYEESMVLSIKEMKFPYNDIRPGQAELMKKALVSLTSKEALFALAPTGTGKTISMLYPAVKGLLRGRYDKIFYLTAKAATRSVASKAVNDMRKKGLLIRSILLSPKEKMCPFKKKCDAKGCPYSEGYYSRLRPALEEILKFDEITPELCENIAMRHRICPHEFSLDTLNYCSIIIGDYNHAFDPRVSLVRCFGEYESGRNVVLVDEAHNLVDRAREMYSAVFTRSLLEETMKEFKGTDPKIEGYLQRLHSYFKVTEQCLSSGNSCFHITENVDENRTLRTENWEGTREMPKNFYTTLWHIVRLMSPLLDSMPRGRKRELTLQFFFEARFFLTCMEQFYNDSYITCAGIDNGDLFIKLSCLDSSDKLDGLIRDKMAVAFFSATLSPFEYYRNVLIGKDADYCRNIELASPFPPENLDLIICSDISTTYKDRVMTSGKLTSRIIDALKGMKGNYMLFFPSFDYMNMIVKLIEEEIPDLENEDGIIRTVVRQKPEMTPEEKSHFLSCFDTPNEGCLIGCAVLGGHFSEGIDLVGERLSGVIIVGVGLPGISPERQVLSNYYSEKFGDGFAFAYRYPGWEKVLQAVGRVIRTENDTGFAMLIDERLDKPEYLSLYPENWRI